MPICSYLVVPEAGATRRVAVELSRMPGCEVVAAQNRDLLILVTETASLGADQALRERVERLDGIECVMLTFGEIDAALEVGDPLAERRSASRSSRPSPPTLGGEGSR
jgi:nitrate reductase NapAB chaperone NapD